MKSRFAFLTATFIAVLALSGCKKSTAKNEGAESTESAKADGLESADAKLDVYIDCYNGIDGRLHQVMERYASWIDDMDVGPTGKEASVYGLYSISDSDVKKCAEAAKTAANPPANAALDNAATAYAAAVTLAAPKVNEAEKY
jgi:Protein of unknown function (DUF3829)